MLSARYAECAVEQGKFWLLHDLILSRQSNWKQLDDAQPAFNQMAIELGFDLQALQTCLEGVDALKAIEKNKAEGQALQIRSTPTYFVNGKMVVGQKSLEQEITSYLEDHGY
jgi:protein-disulfide isomerase